MDARLSEHGFKVVRVMRQGGRMTRMSTTPYSWPHHIFYPVHQPVEPPMPMFLFAQLDQAQHWSEESGFTYPDFEIWRVMTTTQTPAPLYLPSQSNYFESFWLMGDRFWEHFRGQVVWESPAGSQTTRSLALVERVVDGWRLTERAVGATD